MLAQMSHRLHEQRTFEAAIQTILEDVIALHGAEYGNLQLPIGDELAIAAQRGLSAPFLTTFRRVKKDDGCACGRALRLGKPVIVADVHLDDEYAAFRDAAETAGYRSVQSTPLTTSDGKLLGVVSTLFANVHMPTPIEMQTLESYSAVAADHAYDLIGRASLARKAEAMSDKLYNAILRGPQALPRAPTEGGDAASGS